MKPLGGGGGSRDTEKWERIAKMALGRGCGTQSGSHNTPLSFMVQFPLGMVSSSGWDQKKGCFGGWRGNEWGLGAGGRAEGQEVDQSRGRAA